MKAMYGDAATKQTDWAFDYLPKVDRNFSWVQLWDNMYNGIVKGMFAFGMNGVAIGPDSKKNIDALKKPTGWSSAKFTRMKPANSGSRRASPPTK